MEVIKKLPNDQLHDPHAAVYVAVLLLDENQVDAAKEYIDTARRGPIFIEEKKLLDEAPAKVAAAPPKPGGSPTTTTSPGPAKSPQPAAHLGVAP